MNQDARERLAKGFAKIGLKHAHWELWSDFVGQDINATTALMCYIQLSMLGCAGYVAIGDTLRQPDTGSAPNAPAGENVWRTPMYFDAAWTMRRIARGTMRGEE